MGYPYVGETFQMYSQDPNVFFTSKQSKYGPIFKTHILGCPCVMISSPEAAKFVLVTKSNIFKPTFPASKERMLGRQAIFFHQGDYHSKLRKLVLRAFMPQSLHYIVPQVESLALHALHSWEATHEINTYLEMKTVKKTEHSVSPPVKNRVRALCKGFGRLNFCSFLVGFAVYVQCGAAVDIWQGWSYVRGGIEEVLLRFGKGLQFDAGEPSGDAFPQGDEGQEGVGSNRGENHGDEAGDET
ncbi:unnamed protein product [Linum tenue]|uniref:Uncharacterized protein n=1 Tax=Linum tenue TaxID=586396 RepID=A0AAV0JNJ9_9ROSI|nr:unnamed protein product [Linum tenue]